MGRVRPASAKNALNSGRARAPTRRCRIQRREGPRGINPTTEGGESEIAVRSLKRMLEKPRSYRKVIGKIDIFHAATVSDLPSGGLAAAYGKDWGQNRLKRGLAHIVLILM